MSCLCIRFCFAIAFLPYHWLLLSNYMGNIGQQIERSWGDKEWVRRVLERVVNENEQNLPIVVRWVGKYMYTMNVYMVVWPKRDAVPLKCLPLEIFFDVINRSRSTASDPENPPVRKVEGTNIYVVDVSKFPTNIVACIGSNSDLSPRNKIVRLGRLWSTRKKKLKSDYIT